VVRATLSDPADGAMLSEAFYLPDRRACALQPPELSATVERLAGQWWLTVSARRFARWVHVDDAAFRAESDWFHLGPGSSRHIRLLPDPSHEGLDRSPQQAIPMGEVYALNARRPTAYAA
jgi:beta-mannosidase